MFNYLLFLPDPPPEQPQSSTQCVCYFCSLSLQIPAKSSYGLTTQRVLVFFSPVPPSNKPQSSHNNHTICLSPSLSRGCAGGAQPPPLEPHSNQTMRMFFVLFVPPSQPHPGQPQSNHTTRAFFIICYSFKTPPQSSHRAAHNVYFIVFLFPFKSPPRAATEQPHNACLFF